MRPEEFNSIIIPMRDELKASARRMTGDDQTAEDTVQEVMLKLWSMRETLDRYDNKSALAYTILRNLMTDNWRHRRFESVAEVSETVSGSCAPTAEQRDEAALIRRIIDHLPPLQRQMFRLKEIEGYSSDEIIQITGCTAESLRQNLSRARRKIRADFIRLTTMRISRDKNMQANTGTI